MASGGKIVAFAPGALTRSETREVVMSSSAVFLSSDGGWTWRNALESDPIPEVVSSYANRWASRDLSVHTPRGTFEIVGTDIFQTTDGKRERAYSFSHLSNSSNRWAHEHDLSYPTCIDLILEPYSIYFDPGSGNLIVALGFWGVAVGSPDGTWASVGVGPYIPTDLSFTSKLQLMFEPGRLVIYFVAALAIGFTSVALATCFPKRLNHFLAAGAVCIGLFIAVPVSILSGIWLGSWSFIAALIALVLGLPILVIASSGWRVVVRGVGMASCVVALILSLLIVPVFLYPNILAVLIALVPLGVGILSVTVLILAPPARKYFALGAAYLVAICLALGGAAALWVANIEVLLPLGRWLFVLMPLPVIAVLVFHVRHVPEVQDALYP